MSFFDVSSEGPLSEEFFLQETLLEMLRQDIPYLHKYHKDSGTKQALNLIEMPPEVTKCSQIFIIYDMTNKTNPRTNSY